MIYMFVFDDTLTSQRFTTRTEQLTICCEPLQKLRVRLWPCKTSLSPPPTHTHTLFITGRSNAALLLWFIFIKIIPIMCFMLHDFVVTRISFGCSLSPLHFTYFVQASTICPRLFNSCSQCFPFYMFRVGTYVIYFLNMIVLIFCLCMCIIEPLQKLRVRLWSCKTSLSPPVILYY